MAKIFRFSGYFVDGDINQYDVEGFKGALTETILGESTICKFQQLHIEESKDFSNDGELEENCDLALFAEKKPYTETKSNVWLADTNTTIFKKFIGSKIG